MRLGEALRLRTGLLRVALRLGEALLLGEALRLVYLLRVTGEATAAGEATGAALRILRVPLRMGLLRLGEALRLPPFLAARTLAIMALAAAEPLAGRPLRRGEVRRRVLERVVGESNLTILFM